MLKITDDNYEEYKKVFQVINGFLSKWSPVSSTAVDFIDGLEKKSRTLAKRSLKMGLHDYLAGWIKDFSKKDHDSLNEKLLNENLPSLWKLMSIVNDTTTKVLKRGKIRNIDEWYVIKEFLDDTVSEISDEEREILGKYFLDFEMKAAKKNK